LGRQGRKENIEISGAEKCEALPSIGAEDIYTTKVGLGFFQVSKNQKMNDRPAAQSSFSRKRTIPRAASWAALLWNPRGQAGEKTKRQPDRQGELAHWRKSEMFGNSRGW